MALTRLADPAVVVDDELAARENVRRATGGPQPAAAVEPRREPPAAIEVVASRRLHAAERQRALVACVLYALMGRGMMGDGVIDIHRIRLLVEAAGDATRIEAEILHQ